MDNLKNIDNVNIKLFDELKNDIGEDSTLSILAGQFSLYAYQALKKELDSCKDFRFIFTDETFVKNKEFQKKEKKEFYIPKLNREKSIYGTEYEVRLKNELTQKAIARECAEWISKKAKFKTNVSRQHAQGMINVDDKSYTPINEFSTTELGLEKGNELFTNIIKLSGDIAKGNLANFDNLWQDETRCLDVTENIIEEMAQAYQENSPQFLYFFTLYNIFSEFLEDISDDELPNTATGFKESQIWKSLYNFQKDAVIGIINKLERYNGCILADSVGLGKTYTALGVVKYYENRNKNVLILCPKKLSENWNTFTGNYKNNPLLKDRFNYDVLYHTDLSRADGYSNGIDLSRINWENYDLLVIDESHNFRNGSNSSTEDRDNRYDRLMKEVIKKGVKTKVLMLSATPVNNKFLDLKNQLALAYEGDSSNIKHKLKVEKNVEDILKNSQKVFNEWSGLELEDRTNEQLLKNLSFDFFELLDSVTIARSRKHIETYYDTSDIGTFPEKLKPISLRPELTNLKNVNNFKDIADILNLLNLSIYTPSLFIHQSKISKYEQGEGKGLSQYGREKGLKKLMTTNLLKRLESSVYSFILTCTRILNNINDTIDTIDRFAANRKDVGKINEASFVSEDDLDYDDINDDIFAVGRKFKIDLRDMDYLSWKRELLEDKENLELLISVLKDIKPENDSKLIELKKLIRDKFTNPINKDNKKILIFTAFADTAEYIYKNLAEEVKDKYGLDTGLVTGDVDGRSTIKGLTMDFNTILTLFAPKAKDKDLIYPDLDQEITILIATDVISEGQNLQDCDFVVNYDIHWNPVRIIQRFGRVDRIGSKNKYIQLVNFWPDIELDDYINLKARVETRMEATIVTATGDDNPLKAEESADLEFREKQLKKLQEEVVDIEDMNTGISIMDLGLNEYRLDLLDYINTKGNSFEKTPTGIHAVVGEKPDNPKGVIFILKNINNNINKDNRNRIHPFYMVYIGEDGQIINDYLNPKNLLDRLRLLARNADTPIQNLVRAFNKETKDGKKMQSTSLLLEKSIESIIDAKEESDLDSLFTPGGTSALLAEVTGLNDFELITFFVVK